jgi:hypothetical protein
MVVLGFFHLPKNKGNYSHMEQNKIYNILSCIASNFLECPSDFSWPNMLDFCEPDPLTSAPYIVAASRYGMHVSHDVFPPPSGYFGLLPSLLGSCGEASDVSGQLSGLPAHATRAGAGWFPPPSPSHLPPGRVGCHPPFWGGCVPPVGL